MEAVGGCLSFFECGEREWKEDLWPFDTLGLTRIWDAMDIRIIRTDGSPMRIMNPILFRHDSNCWPPKRLFMAVCPKLPEDITLRHLSHLEDSQVPSSFILIRLTWQTSSATAVWSTSIFCSGECRVVHPSAGRISVVGFQIRCCLQRSTGRPRPRSSPSLP